MSVSNWTKNLSGMHATVVGVGRSNLPLIDFLVRHGVTVTARDFKSREALGAIADDLESRGIELHLGAEYLRDIREDLLFRTPGMRPDLPEICEAVARGTVLTSEMELFLALTPATVLGITGSDGKTTTTTLTGLFLEEECKRSGRGRVFVGGNIGEPLLPYVESMTETDFAVVELSSFQLQTAKRSAELAAVTNLSPNHLNWHTDMAEYVEAKTNIYAHAPNRRAVFNAENPASLELLAQYGRAVTLFSSEKHRYEEFAPRLKLGDAAVYARDGKILYSEGGEEEAMLEISRIRLPGKHNLENYMTAIALCHGLVNAESLAAVADHFTGVRHRLEPVRELDGVRYYNSSIDSSPTRTAAALSALAPERPIVIVGGADKNLSFAPLAEALCSHAKAVVLTGAARDKIRAALDAHQTDTLPVYTEPDFKAAVELARSLATKGDIVLLSPACTSFDAFRNFEERGDCFCRIVRAFG